ENQPSAWQGARTLAGARLVWRHYGCKQRHSVSARRGYSKGTQSRRQTRYIRDTWRTAHQSRSEPLNSCKVLFRLAWQARGCRFESVMLHRRFLNSELALGRDECQHRPPRVTALKFELIPCLRGKWLAQKCCKPRCAALVRMSDNQTRVEHQPGRWAAGLGLREPTKKPVRISR